MGQKVHPIGFRLGVTKTWSAQWYADKDYTKLLQEDLRIRKLIDEKLAAASISKVEIERDQLRHRDRALGEAGRGHW